MPEVEYCTRMNLPPEAIWDFVKDMNNWAPFLTGYQAHEILSDTDSVWTLKGDVGILSRVVRLQAHITEWSGPEKVAFTLTGLNEKVDGGGVLVMGPDATDATGGGAVAAARPRIGLWRRLMNALFRGLFRLVHGKGPGRLAPPPGAAIGATSRLTFTLRMDAGGPTAPLVNAMLGPALLPAAEDLANKIAAHLEAMHGLAAPAAAEAKT
jgi:carbon monoxide dehydrogenase subunit G